MSEIRRSCTRVWERDAHQAERGTVAIIRTQGPTEGDEVGFWPRGAGGGCVDDNHKGPCSNFKLVVRAVNCESWNTREPWIRIRRGRRQIKRAIVAGGSNMRARHVDYAQFKHEKSRTIQRITVQSQEAFDPQRRTR